MSVVNDLSVPLFLNHGNDTVPETIVTVKFNLQCREPCYNSLTYNVGNHATIA